MIGIRFGNTRRNGADPNLGYQFDADTGLWIDVLEIEDELLEILDRVDVMVGGRRDQANAWRRVAHFGDPCIHLVAGKLAAFTRFGALGHLYLDVICVYQVLRRHPEPPRRHLFNRGTH